MNDQARERIAALEARVADLERERSTLLESEHRLRTVLDALPIGVWFTDRAGNIVLGNPAGLRLWGGARYVGVEQYGEYKGWRADTGERIQADEWALARALKGETNLDEVVDIECFDGTRKTILNSGVPVRSDAGDIIGAAVINVDITAQKQTERRLARALERLRLHSETSPLAVVEWSSECRVTAWNRAAEGMFGWAAHEVIGKKMDELGIVHPEDWGSVRDVSADMESGARPSNLNRNRNVRRDGRVIHCEWYNSSVHDAAGRLVSVLSFVLDVTSRDEAEEALRTRAEEYAALMDTVPVAIWVAQDPGCRSITGNRTANAFYEAAEGENVSAGAPVRERIVPRRFFHAGREVSADELPMQLAAARDTEVRDFEFEVELPSGRRRTLLGNATPLRDGGGAVRGCVGAFVDISERKEAERAVTVSVERFRRLVEVSSEIVWVSNGDGEAVEDSPSWRALTGRSSEQWAGRKGLEAVHPDDRERLAAAWRTAVSTRTPYHVEFRQPHADGGYRHFECRAAPVLDGAGAVREWVGMNVDVTERKEAERALAGANEQLREAARKKDEFLAMLSHELRNPLAPIRNSVAILNRASPAGEQALRARAVIGRQVDHLARLVDDLLDVTRIARGKIQMRRDRVDVVAVLQGVAEDHRHVMDERGVSLGVQIPSAPVWVDGDATRLSQVFGNLLQNAAKFTQRGGRVTVAALALADHFEVRVADDGAGIPGDLLERIFEPFVQSDQSLDRTHGGLGLGLALVKGVTELHGGSVRAESAGPGRGASFIISLPLVRRDVPIEPQPLPAGTRRPRRILVVDDNHDAGDSLAEFVRMLGHTAAVAYDGPAALQAVASTTFDLVLCDLGLPGMDGFTVARRLREIAGHGRGLRIVAVSGYAQPEDLARAEAAGFDGHIAKPPDPVQIEQLLASGADVSP